MAEATYDGLKIFLPNFSAIVGGSIGLSRIDGISNPQFVALSDGVTLLLTFVCVSLVTFNLISWYGYRKVLSRMTANTEFPVPQPSILKSCGIEAIMCLAMVVACVMFLECNPFKISSSVAAPSLPILKSGH